MEDRRFVAFVDLLGFKRLVLSRSLETTVQIFSRVFYSLGASTARHIVRSNLDPDSINERLDPFPDGKDLPEVIAWFEKETGFSVQIMSDSVILYSEALAPGNPPFLHRLTELILICRTLMLTLFKETLPARGAAGAGAQAVPGRPVGRDRHECAGAGHRRRWARRVRAGRLSGLVDLRLATHRARGPPRRGTRAQTGRHHGSLGGGGRGDRGDPDDGRRVLSDRLRAGGCGAAL